MAGRFFVRLFQSFGSPCGHAHFFRVNQMTKRSDKTCSLDFGAHEIGNHLFPEFGLVRGLPPGGGHAGQPGGFPLNGILALGFCHVVRVGQPHADLSARRATEGGYPGFVQIPFLGLGAHELQGPSGIMMGSG